MKWNRRGKTDGYSQGLPLLRRKDRENPFQCPVQEELRLPVGEAHIGMMEMDDCEKVIRLCRDYVVKKEGAA